MENEKNTSSFWNEYDKINAAVNHIMNFAKLADTSTVERQILMTRGVLNLLENFASPEGRQAIAEATERLQGRDKKIIPRGELKKLRVHPVQWITHNLSTCKSSKV